MPRSVALFDSPDTLALDWKGLYQEHAPRLRRIAERRVGPEQAEDVVQDTFMRAFRNRGSLDPTRPIGAWLSAITLCSSTDTLRRRSTRPEVPVSTEHEPVSTGSSLEDEFDNAVRRMGIEAAFDSLNLRQRRVLKRLEIDGWSHEQVAAVEQLSTEAVKSLAARARRTFRRSYAAFAEHMGVFGGAAVSPALVKLRARLQRWQGVAGEHVGAFGMAVATVTVVAIAAVPTSLESPARADEPTHRSATTAEAANAHQQPSGVSETPDTSVQTNSTSTASTDQASEVPAPTNAEIRAETSATAGRDGNSAGISVTGETDGPQDDGSISVIATFSDCGGVTAGMVCFVFETAQPTE